MEQFQKPYIIGIAGGSASGKTFLLQYTRNRFSEAEVCIISQDNYYRPLQEQQKDANGMVNFDLPDGIDDQRFLADIETLSANKTVETLDYTFNTPGVERKKITLLPAPVIVVEGLFIFYFEAIKNILDYKIFIEAPDNSRLNRRLERDKKERGMTYELILYQWHNHVLPGFEQYLLPFKKEANQLIDNHDENFAVAFEDLFAFIAKIIKRRGSLLGEE